MNWAALVSGLVQLLQYAPQFAADVESFWSQLHQQKTAEVAGHHDEVMAAVADAKARTKTG